MNQQSNKQSWSQKIGCECVRLVFHLNVWTRSWEAWQRSIKAVQDWVDRGEDGPTISTGDEQLSHGGHDEDVGLGPDLGQDGVDGTDAEVVEDLSGLHSLTGGHVQAGHIPTDIGVANNGEKMGSHLDNVCLINQDKCAWLTKISVLVNKRFWRTIKDNLMTTRE